MTPRARRALFTLVIFFVVCAVAGSVLQRKVGAQSSEDESQIRDSLKSFTNVYALVEQNYAEPLSGDKADAAIYDGAIPGMLRTLDPHSNFYDPKAYAKMREDQRGHYYGVGMVIQQQNSKTYVITPYEGTPSFRAGIRPGDIISAVDGKTTDGMTSDLVAKALKGPKGTHVQVTMVREGQAKPMNFDLVRDEIPHPSVDLKYEIRPEVGYIHLTQFQETTAQEVLDAVNSFGNLKGLVLDLRGNPGGLLSQAVEVCDHLLLKGQSIVSQRGRAYPDQNYLATKGNDGKAFPIVVLVNRNTASAAEIVSGALQDHDRALIVGETTFGKGLVQTVYNLSENTGLALTTYHYYTPSGRLIQRNYTGVSLYDYYYNHAGAQPADTTNREVKLTDAGRTVYGGGGITPDVMVKENELAPFEQFLLSRNAYLNFAIDYSSRNKAKVKSADWKPSPEVMDEFRAWLTKEKIASTQEVDEAFAKPDIRDYSAMQIRAEVMNGAFGQEARHRVLAQGDKQIQSALGLFDKAAEMLAKRDSLAGANPKIERSEPTPKGKL